ncbi:PE-PPE domain-containing protein [Mycobacterium sp. NS-7484]|uniref:PE-PPE domain-containing protein n=1 Tax=Mycobacterium sp. NS-7484 TaxID=1834161 RepID=UPI0009FAC5FB|nr:PE-PPE domain-containing protein [Mycobacterium sp. NS-7484]
MPTRVLRGVSLAIVALIGTVGLAVIASMTTLVQLTATALIMGGTGMKALGAPHQWGAGSYVDQVNNTYLSDRHLDEDDLAWVSTPEQFWPATGLTDATFDTSVARGVLSLNNAVLATSGEKIVVGYSQSANIATREKRNLAELRAQGATVPAADELSFVLIANPNRPNGGILARFEGLYIPILGISFDGATPDDEYATIDVAREYDLIADFPKYPLNLLADLNALMGYVYLHPNYGSSVVHLDDPSTYQSYTSGNTTYYLVHTEHLPLLQPLRDIRILDPALDLIEPTLRVLIDLAYDRTPEHMGVPTRAGLFPDIDWDKLASDLTAAANDGIRDALADLGIDVDRDGVGPESPAPLGKSAPRTTATGGVTDPDTLPRRVGPHLSGLRSTTDGHRFAPEDTETDADADPATDAGRAPQTGPVPEQESEPSGSDTKATSERTRKPLRQSLIHKKTSDIAEAEATSPQARPDRPDRRVHRVDHDKDAAGTSAEDTKDPEPQSKPRHPHRVGKSDGSRDRASAGVSSS